MLAVAALSHAEADAKKSPKKAEKVILSTKTKTIKIDKDSKTHKRGLYPDPILGSTYALPGAVPLEVYHSDPAEHLSVTHDCDGLYGGVYGHLDAGAPVVAATYAPGYSSDSVGHAAHGSYSSYGHGFLGGFPGGLHGLEALLGGVKIEEGTIRVKTITTHVPVPVPHPVPVEVIKRVPVRVEEKIPVDVPRAVPVEVPQPYPVEVEKPYPVEVPKPVPQFVPYPVHYKVPKPYPVEVPTPYNVEVHKPVPVAVPHPVEVHEPVHVTPAPYKQEVFYPTTPKPYYPSSTVVPAYTAAPAVVSVTKCDEDHGLSYPNPTSIPFVPSFAKDIFSVSSLKSSPVDHGYHPSPAPSYHSGPVHSYPTVAPVHTYAKVATPVVSITPVPAYSTAVVTPVVPSYHKVVTPVFSHPAPSYSYPKAVTAVHSYPTVAPVLSYPTSVPATVSYPTSEPCDEEYISAPLPSYPKAPSYNYAHTVSVPSYPKAPTYNYEHTAPAPAYPKAPSYNYAHTVSVPSYPKAPSYNYEHAVPASSYPPRSYGYGSGAATSFVGMTSHGTPSFGDYKSEISHPQLLSEVQSY